MEHRVSQYVSRKLVKGHIIDEIYEEYYTYGIELVLSFLVSVTLIVLFSLLIKFFISSVIFIVVFILLRRFTGGLHADTHLKCKISTVLTYLAVVALSYLVSVDLTTVVLLGIIGILMIAAEAPIENPNKPLNDHKKRNCRIAAVITFSSLSVLAYILMIFSEKAGNIAFFSIYAVLLLMVIPIIQERRIGHNEENR